MAVERVPGQQHRLPIRPREHDDAREVEDGVVQEGGLAGDAHPLDLLVPFLAQFVHPLLAGRDDGERQSAIEVQNAGIGIPRHAHEILEAFVHDADDDRASVPLDELPTLLELARRGAGE